MQLAFGDDHTYDRAGLAIVAVGMGFYLSAVTLNQAALAQGQARRAALCWVTCAVAFIVFNLIQPLDPYRTVEVGLHRLRGGALGAALPALPQPAPGRRGRGRPGSPRARGPAGGGDEIG